MGARPADLNTLLRHVRDGVVKLEQAWSRALDESDVEELLGEWHSFIRAIGGELAYRDAELGDDARVTWPPAIEELEALDLNPEPALAAHQARLAQFAALESLADSLGALERPTHFQFKPREGQARGWWASGAFATVKDRADLVRDLLSHEKAVAVGAPRNGEAHARLRRAARAWSRGDPDAALLHSVGAMRACQAADTGESSSDADAATSKLLDLGTEACRRIASGAPVDLGAVVVLAIATFEAARKACGSG